MGVFIKLSLFAALALGNVASLTDAQFVRAPTDLVTKAGSAGISIRYKEVPTGTCETRPNVTHLSGFADVSPDSHIYFQFFETRKGDPKQAPLTVWINGGPGSTSMIGLYEEVGSCSITSDLKAVDNPISWNEVSNMLFIDQPVTVANSYSEPGPAYINPNTGLQSSLPDNVCPDYAVAYGTCGTYSSSNISNVPRLTVDAAQSFYLALQGFIGAFPEYAASGVNIASESYGGHYVPSFAQTIVEKGREALTNHTSIDLRSISLGNAYYNEIDAFTSHLTYMEKNPYGLTYPNSSIVDEIRNNLQGRDNCIDQLKDCYRTDDPLVCDSASHFCSQTVEQVYSTYLGRDYYDMRQVAPSPFPPGFFVGYLNLEATQQALGLFQNVTSSSRTIAQAFGAAGDAPREGRKSVERLRFLLDAGVHVAMFVGDADFICNADLQNVTSKAVGAKGFDEAGWVNLTTSDGIVHGQTKQSGIFSYTQFYFAGHAAPIYQPLATLEFIDRVINRKDVATGTQNIEANSTYKTVGPAENFVFHGNATVEVEPLPLGSTYNTTTGRGDPPTSNGTAALEGDIQPLTPAIMSRIFGFWNRGPFKRSIPFSIVQDRL